MGLRPKPRRIGNTCVGARCLVSHVRAGIFFRKNLWTSIGGCAPKPPLMLAAGRIVNRVLGRELPYIGGLAPKPPQEMVGFFLFFILIEILFWGPQGPPGITLYRPSAW